MNEYMYTCISRLTVMSLIFTPNMIQEESKGRLDLLDLISDNWTMPKDQLTHMSIVVKTVGTQHSSDFIYIIITF